MSEPTNIAAARIEALILETSDVKDKALLLVMLEMSKSLNENTSLTKELHGEFKEHAKEEMALIIKGRFLWRILLSLALILQGALGYVFKEHLDNHKRLVDEVRTINTEMERHKEHHRMEEKYNGKSDSPKVR